MVVRFVELVVVVHNLTVEINNIAEVVEKAGDLVRSQIQVLFHRTRNLSLVVRVLYAPGVANGVEGNLLVMCRTLADTGHGRLQVVVIGRLSEGRRKRLKTLRAVSERRKRMYSRMRLRTVFRRPCPDGARQSHARC